MLLAAGFSHPFAGVKVNAVWETMTQKTVVVQQL
jgi:hypothetical protein